MNVTQVYPSQTFTLLNASGYVVAQRKAAVASKVNGRLVALSVEEGSRVESRTGDCRLGSEGCCSLRKDQAAANLNAAQHNLEQAKADLQDTTITFNR